jgi:hypothetical protein
MQLISTKLPLKSMGSKQSTSGLKQWRSKMDEARGEEATQSDQQQECILSGGVYLRHRPRKASSPKICMPDFPDRDTIAQEQKAYNMRRSGVLACKKLCMD